MFGVMVGMVGDATLQVATKITDRNRTDEALEGEPRRNGGRVGLVRPPVGFFPILAGPNAR